MKTETFAMHTTHLLVPCTAKKSLSASESFCIENQITGSMEQTMANWIHAFQGNHYSVKASELYVGTAFRKLKQLAHTHQLKLHVLSAGFGVVSENTYLPGYNATFSNHTSKVPTPHNQWWSELAKSELPGCSITELFKSFNNDRFIVCASKEYLNVVQNDLFEAISHLKKPDSQIVIIASEIPLIFKGMDRIFVKTDRKCLSYPPLNEFKLALTDRNITALVTHQFVTRLAITNLNFGGIIRELNHDFEKLELPSLPVRSRRDDDFILSYIQEALAVATNPTFSAVYKTYKNDGNACSDSRFRKLYNSLTKQ